MIPWQLIIFVCLWNAILCTVAVFTKKYQDNIFQRIGLSLLAMISYARVRTFWTYEYDIGLIPSWFYIGLWFYLMGTAWKVVFYEWLINHKEYWRFVRLYKRQDKDEEHIKA